MLVDFLTEWGPIILAILAVVLVGPAMLAIGWYWASQQHKRHENHARSETWLDD